MKNYIITASASKGYINVDSTKGYITLPSKISVDCDILQKQKDDLLAALSAYFAREIERIDIQGKLEEIKKNITKISPGQKACC